MVGFNISLRVDFKSLQGIIPGFPNGIPSSNLKINSVHALRGSLLFIRTCNLFLEVFAAKLTRVVITSLKSPEKKTKTHEHHHLTNIGPQCWPSIFWRPVVGLKSANFAISHKDDAYGD